jgi:hypothetical protein
MLVTLDEEFSGGRRSLGRRLLSSTLQEQTGGQSNAAVSSVEVQFPVGPDTVLAQSIALEELCGGSGACEVDPKTVEAAAAEWAARATAWKVRVPLTRGQACNRDREAVKKELAKGVEAAFKASASNVKQVQVRIDSIDMKTENCYKVNRDGSSRRAGENDMSTAEATGQAEVLFSSDEAKINPKLLNEQPGIINADPPSDLPDGYVLDNNFFPSEEQEETASSSSSMIPIIAGAAGGGACCLGIVIGGYMMMKRRNAEPEFSTADAWRSELAGYGAQDLEDQRGAKTSCDDLKHQLRMETENERGPSSF